MILSLVVAYARGGVIGKDNKLPWRLSADLRRFRTITLGKPVVMGRRTFESIGHPLDGRTNIVLTRDPAYLPEGALVARSLDEGIRLAGEAGEIVVIGGADVFAQALPRADRMYVTEIDAEIDGDRSFPDFDRAEWREVERSDHGPDERNAYRYRFVTLERTL